MSKRKGKTIKASTPRTPRKGKPSRMAIKRRYIAGEQYRYDWLEADVQRFIRDYIDAREDGVDSLAIITGLAGKYSREAPEVALLIMDLGDRGYIGPQGKGTKPRPFRIVDCEESDE